MELIERVREISKAMTDSQKGLIMVDKNRERLETSPSKGFNPLHMYTVLNYLVGGKVLFKGPYGTGKTMAPLITSSLMGGIPLEIAQIGMFQGHPEVSKFDLYGTLDLGKLQEGKERILWSIGHMFNMPKIFDEFSRIPEGKQGIVLSGIENGIWTLGNNSIAGNGEAFYATSNYNDDGTSTIIPPILDRFDLLIQAEPLPLAQQYLAQEAVIENRVGKLKIGKSELLKDLAQIIQESVESEDLVQKVRDIPEQIMQEYRKQLQTAGFPAPLTTQERAELREKIHNMPMYGNAPSEDSDLDPGFYLHSLVALLNAPNKFGSKNSENPPVTDEGSEIRDQHSLGRHLKYPISPRFWRGAMTFAKALAYYDGASSVELPHVKAVLPYALALATFDEDFAGSVRASHRDYPVQTACAKKIIHEFDIIYGTQGEVFRDAMKIAYQLEIAQGNGDSGAIEDLQKLAMESFEQIIPEGKDDSRNTTAPENPVVIDLLSKLEKAVKVKGNYL